MPAVSTGNLKVLAAPPMAPSTTAIGLAQTAFQGSGDDPNFGPRAPNTDKSLPMLGRENAPEANLL
jgi:hypothetical protein